MTVARGATKKRLQRWCHCNDSRSSSGNFPQHFPNSHFPKGERDGRRPFVTKILQTSFCRTFCNTQWVKINQNISFLHWKSCGFKSHFEHFLAKILGSNPNVRLFWVIFNHCVTSKVHFYSSFSYRNYEAKRFEMVATEGFDDHIADMELFCFVL